MVQIDYLLTIFSRMQQKLYHDVRHNFIPTSSWVLPTADALPVDHQRSSRTHYKTAIPGIPIRRRSFLPYRLLRDT